MQLSFKKCCYDTSDRNVHVIIMVNDDFILFPFSATGLESDRRNVCGNI